MLIMSVMVELDQWAMVTRRSLTLRRRPIAEVPLEHLTPLTFYRDYVAENRPVVIKVSYHSSHCSLDILPTSFLPTADLHRRLLRTGRRARCGPMCAIFARPWVPRLCI